MARVRGAGLELPSAPIPAGAAVAIFATATVLYFVNHGIPEGYGFLDFLFFGLWLLLIGWCFSPRRLVDSDSHEGSRKRLAFRAGKALNRVLHYLRRNPAIRD